MDAEKTGALIRECRKGKNMTQLDLALQIGVTQKAVSKWETGHGMPDTGVLESLAQTLDLSPTELIIGERILGKNVSKDKIDASVSSMIWKDYSRRQRLKNLAINMGLVLVLALAGIVVASDVATAFAYYNADIANPDVWAKPSAWTFVVRAFIGASVLGKVCMGIALAALVALIWRLLNPDLSTPSKAEPETVEAFIVEKKMDISPLSMSARPSVVLRLYGDKKLLLHLDYMKTYDTLNPGDSIRVTYRGSKLTDYEMIEEGAITREKAEKNHSE